MTKTFTKTISSIFLIVALAFSSHAFADAVKTVYHIDDAESQGLNGFT